MTAIRTPSTVAKSLLYDTTRDLTFTEQAYLTAYHRITNRTVRFRIEAERLFGKQSRAAFAAVWQAEQQERTDLDRALAAFDDAVNGTNVVLRHANLRLV